MVLRAPCLRPGVGQVPGARTRLPKVRGRRPGPLRGRPGSFPPAPQQAPRGLALLPHRGPRHSPWPRSSGPGPAASPTGAAAPPAPLAPPPWPPTEGCPARCLPAARRRPPGRPGAGSGAGGPHSRAKRSCSRPRSPPRKVPGVSGPPTALAAGGRPPQDPAGPRRTPRAPAGPRAPSSGSAAVASCRPRGRFPGSAG